MIVHTGGLQATPDLSTGWPAGHPPGGLQATPQVVSRPPEQETENRDREPARSYLPASGAREVTCTKCGRPCRHGRYRCDPCQTETDARRGHPLPPKRSMADALRSRRETTMPIQSNRQRTIVITFNTPADADAFDQLDDATALATLIAILTERPYARLRAVDRD